MLRTHFNQSQFVVVSLKDGMFNNANVLFKTDFVDGISVVKRCDNNISISHPITRCSFTQAQPIADDGKENPAAAGKSKKTSASGKGPVRALNV